MLLSTLLQDILHPSHHLLNVLLQIANKLGLSNKKKVDVGVVGKILLLMARNLTGIPLSSTRYQSHYGDWAIPAAVYGLFTIPIREFLYYQRQIIRIRWLPDIIQV
jgi:hypothetical protein